jgi:phytoene dehydrogenase-like protein
VVAACDPQRVFVDWVDDPPPAARALVERWRAQPVHDGYESKVDAVIGELPRYRAAAEYEARRPGSSFLEPTLIVSPSPAQLELAHAQRESGRVAAEPTMLANVPSVLDPSMVPQAGGHVLSLEVLFTPYALEGGWPDSDEPRRWLDVWARFAEPGVLDSLGAWRAMTPDRYEAEFAMHRGHTPSYAGSPLSALLGKQRELTRYRSPIAGLYLSGAATFPGAGVFGAPGRNAADVVRRDLTGPIGSRLAQLRDKVGAVIAARATS